MSTQLKCQTCKTPHPSEQLTFSEDGKKLLCPNCRLDEEYRDEPVFRSWLSEYDSDGF